MIGYETVASFSNTDESITMCYHQTSSINVMTLSLKFLFTCFEALKEKNSMLSNSNDNEYTLQSVQCVLTCELLLGYLLSVRNVLLLSLVVDK